MNIACRLFEQTAVLTIADAITEATWSALAPELDELVGKHPNILISFLVEIPPAVLPKVLEFKNKFKGKEKIVLVGPGKLDDLNVSGGLKLLKSNAAKRIIDILRAESEIKEQSLHIKSAAGIITSQISDLLKLPMPENPYTSNEVALYMLTIKKEIVRLRHLNTAFQKEITLLEKQKPNNSSALLAEAGIKNSIDSVKKKAVEALKTKGLVP